MARSLALVAALFAVALIAPAHAQTHWVVDGSGGGQFTSLQDAIDAASPGDVLLVHPGSYGAALLTKQLAILGAPGTPRPVVAKLDVLGADAFTLVHLEIRAARIVDVASRSIIDDCKLGLGHVGNGVYDVVHVSAASDLLISRSEILGSDGSAGIACIVLRVHGGTLQLVDCTVTGSTISFPFASSPHFGETALQLEDGARAWIVASTLVGANGATSYGGQGPDGGSAGAALRVLSGARADVRGTASDVLDAGSVLGWMPGNDAGAIACEPGAGPVTWSGVTLAGSVGPCAAPTRFAPFLQTAGTDGPGLVREVAVTGAAGSFAVLVPALGSASLDVPWLATTSLWLAPGSEFALLPLALTGSSMPVVVQFTQPPTAALAGLAVHLQAFELAAAGAVLGTNANALVLTW